MTMELAMILTGCLIVLGSAGMASFLIWLRRRDAMTMRDGRVKGEVRLGDALAALSHKIGLTNEDFEVFQQVKDEKPAVGRELI